MPAYTPPAGNAVNLNFTGAYTPPAGNAVILNFNNPNAYVLTADPGSYAITGTSASIRADRTWVVGVGSELITNGAFTVNAAGWTAVGTGVTFASVSGVGTLTLDGTATGGFADQAISVVAGQFYTLRARIIANSTSHALIYVGSTAGSDDLGSAEAAYAVTKETTFVLVNGRYRKKTTRIASGVVDVEITFQAPASTIYVSLTTANNHSCSAGFDNISIADPSSSTYLIVGTDATLTKAGRILTASGGTYAVTGSPVSLTVQRRISLDSGVYTKTQPPIALRVGRVLAAASGSYGITGSTISLNHIVGRFIFTAEGSYNVVGGDARLIVGRKISLGSGSYNLTGAAASWVYRRLLRATPGSYAIVGSAMTFRIGYRLGADPGAYSLIGTDADLINRRLIADPGVYSLDGTAARLLVGKRLQVIPGVYTVIGSNASLLQTRRLVAAPGGYALTGSPAGLRSGRLLTATAGIYSLVGDPARLLRGYTVHAAPGVYAMTWATARVLTTRRMLAAAGVYRSLWPDVELTPTWRPRGLRAIAAGFAASRYLHVSAQNRRVAAGRQDRRIAVEPAPRRYAAVESLGDLGPGNNSVYLVTGAGENLTGAGELLVV